MGCMIPFRHLIDKALIRHTEDGVSRALAKVRSSKKEVRGVVWTLFMCDIRISRMADGSQTLTSLYPMRTNVPRVFLDMW
jgi:hypothetical protein